MAIIGSIRKRGTLLLFIIGGALVAFILGDALGTGGGGQQLDQSIGSIDGKDIDPIEYEFRVQRQIDGYTQAGAQLDENFTKQVRNQVWNNMIQERLVLVQANDLGLVVPNTMVTDGEYKDMLFGDNISPILQSSQDFKDPNTGAFNPEYALQVVALMETQFPAYWSVQEELIRTERVYAKYNELVSKAMYVTHMQGRMAYKEKNDKLRVSYVVKRYTDIPDSAITYGDADLQAYYDAHKDEKVYERKTRRNISYVEWMMEPSEGDRQLLMDDLALLKEDFAKAPNDSIFCVRYSSDRQADVYEYNPGTGGMDIYKEMVNADSSTVIGPFEADGMFRIAKVIQDTLPADTVVNGRHILIGLQAGRTYAGDTTGAQALVDSITSAIDGGADFGALAAKYSDDPGSGANGGDLGFYRRGMMVPAFDSASFASTTVPGQYTVVLTSFGYHILEVVSRGPVVRCLTVDANIEPLDQTITNYFEIADDFAATNNNTELFTQAATAQGLNVIDAPNVLKDFATVNGLEDSRQLVDWAFSTEENRVSEAFEMGDRIVVATITMAREEGPADFEEVREAIEAEVKKEKKYALYSGLMAGATLDEVAANSNGQLIPNQELTLSSVTMPGGGGSEPTVVGTVFSYEVGAMSGPLQGTTGVYVVQVDEKIASPTEADADILAERETAKTLNKSRAAFDPLESMKRAANIEDNRRN